MKKYINIWEYAGHILEATDKGVLMTTAADGETDTMAIGWGTMGNQWHKPMYIAFVRRSRHTKTLLDKSGEFTVNIPWGEYDHSIIGYCGTKSGRDVDKFKELDLETVPGETVAAPAIRQLPLTLECKVIYKQEQDIDAINEENRKRYYNPESPRDCEDYHTAYYGEITAAYILE